MPQDHYYLHIQREAIIHTLIRWYKRSGAAMPANIAAMSHRDVSDLLDKLVQEYRAQE